MACIRGCCCLSRAQFSIARRSCLYDRNGRVHRERQLRDDVPSVDRLVIDAASDDRSSPSNRIFRAGRLVPHHACLVVCRRPCLWFYHPVAFWHEIRRGTFRHRARPLRILTFPQRALTMRAAIRSGRQARLTATFKLPSSEPPRRLEFPVANRFRRADQSCTAGASGTFLRDL